MSAESLAAVDWTPSPSAAAASIRRMQDEDALFFGDDTVVDNPYGFTDDDDDDDVDELAQTQVLLSGRSAARVKPASLPGFRPPADLDALPRHGSPTSTEAPITVLATSQPVAWWARPRAQWLFGGCAFLLSGALWAVFAWLMSRS